MFFPTHPLFPLLNQILSVYDLPHETATLALRRLHRDAHPSAPRPQPSVLEAVVNLVGGRTSYLNRCARSEDMLEEAKFMVRSEREWLMSKIGLMWVPPPPPTPPRATWTNSFDTPKQPRLR